MMAAMHGLYRFTHSVTGRLDLLTRQVLLAGKRIGAPAGLVRAASTTYHGWEIKEGKFNSVRIILKEGVPQGEDFKTKLQACLCDLKQNYKDLKAVSLYVPMNHCHVCPSLVDIGFKVHHAKTEYILLTKWMIPGELSKVPGYCNHQVGVSGFVFDEDNRTALVVQDKGKTTRWKFPGGFAEPGEDISETCVREVREETGIKTEFRSILTFREQHGMMFGQTDLYFICRLHPLTHTIDMCKEEIVKCEWLPIDNLLNDEIATPLTQLVTRLILKGSHQGYNAIDLVSSKMKGWVPPFKYFNVYHHNVDNPN